MPDKTYREYRHREIKAVQSAKRDADSMTIDDLHRIATAAGLRMGQQWNKAAINTRRMLLFAELVAAHAKQPKPMGDETRLSWTDDYCEPTPVRNE